VIEEEKDSPQSPAPSPQEEGSDAAAEEPGAQEQVAEEPAPEEAAPEEPQAAPEEPPADEPEAEAPEPEPEAEEAGEKPEPEELSPKQRRKLSRSRFTGERRPPLGPEERQQERLERRRRKSDARRRWRRRARERDKAAPSAEPAQPVERARGKPRVRQGVVVSDRADKTITVRIDMQRPHRTYGKIVRTSSTLHAHDESNQAHVGDKVSVVESKPLSRTKRWRLVEVLERAR
jgi:small subunit ribosomal protein S17